MDACSYPFILSFVMDPNFGELPRTFMPFFPPSIRNRKPINSPCYMVIRPENS
jgi:hypothetical protein